MCCFDSTLSCCRDRARFEVFRGCTGGFVLGCMREMLGRVAQWSWATVAGRHREML